jgi:hypothetical protein
MYGTSSFSKYYNLVIRTSLKGVLPEQGKNGFIDAPLLVAHNVHAEWTQESGLLL